MKIPNHMDPQTVRWIADLLEGESGRCHRVANERQRHNGPDAIVQKWRGAKRELRKLATGLRHGATYVEKRREAEQGSDR